MILPKWYKSYFFTHTDFEDPNIEERPIEYVYYAIKQRPFLINLIADNYKFCLENPYVNIRKLRDCISNILTRFKQLILQPKELIKSKDYF